MNSATSAQVSVVIAAYNAENTVEKAIQSACAQPEAAEIIVIDDASTDGTCAVVQSLAERVPRLRLIALDVNQGPGAARNRGFDAATTPWVAILDADDFFLEGRLGRLTFPGAPELVADNIAFTNANIAQEVATRTRQNTIAGFESLTAEEFVRGNLRRRGIARGELGFLKPLLSVAFLNAHGLRYDETLRLGEDYDLYTRMFLAGARMSLTRTPGYGAVIRHGSLSALHRTADLERLHDALACHLVEAERTDAPQSLCVAMRDHLQQVRIKRDHRRFLDIKAAEGAAAAFRYAFATAARPGPIFGAIARDKLRLGAAAGDDIPNDGIRLLLPTS